MGPAKTTFQLRSALWQRLQHRSRTEASGALRQSQGCIVKISGTVGVTAVLPTRSASGRADVRGSWVISSSCDRRPLRSFPHLLRRRCQELLVRCASAEAGVCRGDVEVMLRPPQLRIRSTSSPTQPRKNSYPSIIMCCVGPFRPSWRQSARAGLASTTGPSCLPNGLC